MAKYCPIEAYSLDEFIDLIHRKRGNYVVAKPSVEKDTICDFHQRYFIQFQSHTHLGRPIIFNKTCFYWRPQHPENSHSENNLNTVEWYKEDAHLLEKLEKDLNVKIVLISDEHQ